MREPPLSGGNVLGTSNRAVKRAAAGDRPRRNERNFQSQDPAARAQVSPADNESLVGILYNQIMGRIGAIQIGTILFAAPYANWYRVLCDQSGELICTNVSEASSQPFATTSGTILPPRTLVLVYKPPASRLGYILGALPRLVADNEKFLPDFVSQGANMGFHADDYYGKKLFTIPKQRGGIVDFSCGRPLAGTALGEWSRVTALGGGLFLDPFMAYMRVDETCGLWLHYFDRLARLAGYNLDVQTAISEEQVRNDEYEGMYYRGMSPYPWEVLASFAAKKEIHKENENKAVLFDEAWYSKHEPEEDDYQPFYRYEEWGGYLGQGFMRQVSLPPDVATGFNRFSDDEARMGVFREQIGLDGSYALQSAHSIVVKKRCLIPVPKRLKMPEDDTGDVGDGAETTSNYKFAGEFGEGGDEHKIRAHPEAEGDWKNVLNAAALSDIEAYVFNWKGLHPFHYHKEDFETPQVSDTPRFSRQQTTMEFSNLETDTFINQPFANSVRVDGRDGYQNVEYWETTAGFAILPDGGFVLRDGYGAEIMMTGGNIHLSCPGDVFLRPGRSVVAWGGDDVVIRAKKSIDLSAATNDVRIKAEQNLEMLSGNSGKGRMLLENRASGIDHSGAAQQGEDIENECGVIIKAKNSEFASMSRRAYIRTGNTEGGIQEGEIVLDASKGNQPIRMIASDLDAHTDQGLFLSFPAGAATKRAVYNLAEARCFIPCETMIEGFLTNSSHFLCHGHMMADGGHIFTSIQDPHVWDFKSKPTPTRGAIEYEGQKLETNEQIVFSTRIETLWWSGAKIGADDIQEKVEFGFRTEQQYGTSRFLVPEAYWQQLARGTGTVSANTWTEPAVRFQNNDTRPYPGNNKWTTDEVFMRVDLQMWDGNNQQDKDRPDPYEEPKLKWGLRKKLDGQYPTINPA